MIFNSETSNNSIAVSNNNNICSDQLDLKRFKGLQFKHNITVSKLKTLTPAGMQQACPAHLRS